MIIADPVSQFARQAPSLPRPSGLTIGRIAVADDDPDCLDLVSQLLSGRANEVHFAISGAELVVLLAERGPFDLIVTDVDMPWVEGLAVMRAVRAASIDVPALMMTGLARPELQSEVDQLGNAWLLRKPFGPAEFRRAVSAALGAAPSFARGDARVSR